MKLRWMVILGVALLTGQAFAEEPLVLKSLTEKENYTNGVTIARNLKKQAGVINLDILIKGMMDELRGEKLLLAEDDLQKTLAALQAEIDRKKTQTAMKRGEVKAPADTMTMKANTAPNTAPASKKEEAQAQKTVPNEQAAQIAPAKVATSVVERTKVRGEVKKRAAELRRRTIEQERRGAAGQRKAI